KLAPRRRRAALLLGHRRGPPFRASLPQYSRRIGRLGHAGECAAYGTASRFSREKFPIALGWHGFGRQGEYELKDRRGIFPRPTGLGEFADALAASPDRASDYRAFGQSRARRCG